MRNRALTLLFLLSILLVANACIRLSVKELPMGRYTLIKVSYLSQCEGRLKISMRIEGADIYAVSGDLKVVGNTLIFQTETFPSDVGGFEIRTVGRPWGEIYVYLNKQLILKYVISYNGCLDYSISQIPYGMYYLGYMLPKDANMIGLTFLNKCNRVVETRVEVKMLDDAVPLHSVKAVKCLLKKQYVDLVKECIEYTCAQWSVVGSTCSLKNVTWHIEKGKIVREEKCVKTSPIYACTHKTCNKFMLVPHIREVCLRTSHVQLISSLRIVDDGFAGKVEVPPEGITSLKLFVRMPQKNDLLAKVKVDHTEFLLENIPYHNEFSRMEWPVVIFFILSVMLALMIYYMF